MKTVAVIGGGAAGFFGALTCKRLNPHLRVIIFEKTEVVLAKVRISGGGRCNVTHSCFDIQKLCLNYPRGAKELKQAFHQFQPKDTINWFLERGVFLKVEPDGRMFPVTDSSETIINCFIKEAANLGVEIEKGYALTTVAVKGDRFELEFSNKSSITVDSILIATGSNKKTHAIVEQLGHLCVPDVPSLFTFSLPNSPLLSLSGVAVDDAEVKLGSFTQRGPILITHWGLSGPAILKLSAWAARELYSAGYKADIQINWTPSMTVKEVENSLLREKETKRGKQVGTDSLFLLPKSLWKHLVCNSMDKRWQDVSIKEIRQLSEKLTADSYKIDGKTTYKEEFVTCGGITLKEVDFKTMQSKLVKQLYFAGEVLDIDAVTGGFNFQNAWTTGYIAGRAIALSFGNDC